MSSSSASSDDRGSSMVSAAAVFIVLPTLAVLGRFWSRLISRKQRLGWDDRTCVVALVINIGLSVTGYIWKAHGLGRHIADISLYDAEVGLKVLFSDYFLFGIGVGFVKSSALFFYGRLFSQGNRPFRIAIWLGHIAVVGWIIFTIAINAGYCTPVAKNWNPTIPGKCLNGFLVYLFSGLYDCLLDLYILILPVPILWNLKLKKSKRWWLVLVFVLGYSCLVISIGRFVSTLVAGESLDADLTYNAISVIVWAQAELGIGIISICLPTWWQLYRQVSESGFASLFSASTFKSYNYETSATDLREEDNKHIYKTTSVRINSETGSNSA